MKKIIILTLTSVLYILSYGQEFPKAGDHLQDPNQEKFVGTWKGAAGDTTFTIVFQIAQQLTSYGYTYDYLAGWHELKIGGVVVESSMDKIGQFKIKEKTCWGGSNIIENVLAKLSFYDITRDKFGDACFRLDSTEASKAVWTLKNCGGLRIKNEGGFDPSFTAPTKVVMYKIE